jgi:hypothetical protein
MPSRTPADKFSGAQWLDVFPEHTGYDDLETDFKNKVLEFKDALANARVVPNDINLAGLDPKTLDTTKLAVEAIRPAVASTFRSPERCYLIHWAWLIYHEHLSNEVFNPPADNNHRIRLGDGWAHWFGSAPDQTLEGWATTLHDWNIRLIEGIPPFDPKASQSEINIQWLHRATDGSPDLASSISGAREICKKAKLSSSLKGPPALASRHSEGKAIDWTFNWSASRLLMMKKSGDPLIITTTPHDQTNLQMVEVAKTYGVVRLAADYGDPPHYSSDGS